ncbi:N-acetylmuramoyl-L-alanine amidase [Bacillus sp. FJAT-29953]|nr:N-acetylmuramoyl-L-alanine amidase [Bacillus sp. FJAT-29953]
MKIYLDPGHGGTDPGAQGNGLNEKDVTLDISLRLRNILINQYENVEVKMSRESDISKSLSARTNEANAWGADYYLSIHINAASSAAQGYEDYIYNGLSDSSQTAKYREIIHGEVVKMNQLIDRGMKKANFHVLRESTMPAMLSENGFITNAHDAGLMKQAAWRQDVAQGHANGLAKAFNLQRKPAPSPPPSTGTLYKVIAGSFQSKENADKQVALLKSKGFEAFVDTVVISGTTWYRAQAGAFSSRENAEERMNTIKNAGFPNVFISVE